MAKMDVLKALAVLEESGIKLSRAQEDSLREFKAQTMTDNAVKYIDGKVHENVDSTAFVAESFRLAEAFSTEVKGNNVGRGRGEVHEKVVRFDTPSGTLKISLTTEPQSAS